MKKQTGETPDISEFVVTARKWRPLKFEDVVGQAHVTVTLRNAIAGNRLAHAYLFSGPRGVGKTTTARLLAKVVNCLNPVDGNPDNVCEICREITEGRSFDTLEIDGASNRGVDEIRSLREAVRYPPAKGRFKTYIIDEVHMLTKEAFNALLKTLEEPPRHVLFIFATTEIHKVPATILSRCQRFEFRRLSSTEISGNLRVVAEAEDVRIDEEALALLARKADGSLRDAQSLFDQTVSLCGKEISHEQIMNELRIVDLDVFFRVTDLVRRKDAKAVLELVEEIVHRGYDLREFLWGLLEHLRNFLVVRITGSTDLIDAADAYKRRYQTDAGDYTVADLLRLLRLVSGTEESVRRSNQPRFRLEADLVQLTEIDSAVSVGDLLKRIDDLKKKGVEGVTQEPVVVPTGGSRMKSSPSATAPVQPVPPSDAPLPSEKDVQRGWGEFLLQVKKKRISLGTSLDATRLLGIKGDCLRIGCPDEFAMTSIRRNKADLQEILQSVFHSRLYLEPELDQRPAGAPESASLEEGTAASAPKEEKQHPVLEALIRELGAEPL